MLRVTPLYGSRWDNSGVSRSGSCTLIEYADIKVLVDNNNTSASTSSTTASTKKSSSESFWENLPPHDCLVLTDSTLESMGSLPLYDNNDDDTNNTAYMDVVPPIFATFPTVKMGQMSLYDYHANISLDGCTPSFTLEEMDRAISLIRTIKYSQTLSLPFPLMEAPPSPFVTITAHMAGHVVGGAFYKFVRLRDETSVVITHVYHIARELHLDAATLLRDGSGVDVLITYPGGSASLSKVRRDITERILGLLRRDANVLLPVDASGRSLELVLLLDRFWSRNNLSNTFNLVWFGPMVHNTLEFTRSQLEWMNSVLKQGGDGDFDRGGHPYALRNVKLCTNLAELEKIISSSNDNPTCVLANGLSLDHGPARDLLLKWSDNDNNAILF
ncbi:hypothetical protein FRACYDRAFT_174306, partial [Fragilariopsis cylindrus CCMP1102]